MLQGSKGTAVPGWHIQRAVGLLLGETAPQGAEGPHGRAAEGTYGTVGGERGCAHALCLPRSTTELCLCGVKMCCWDSQAAACGGSSQGRLEHL